MGRNPIAGRCPVATALLLELHRWSPGSGGASHVLPRVFRLGLALAALAAGGFATLQATGEVYATTDSALAAKLAPYSASITGTAARSRLEADPKAADNRANAAELAAAALIGDPTSVEAVATRGLVAEFNGELPAARKAFTYVERLSRRDLPSELWMIEDSVRREDIAGALHHYDVALRVQPAASDILFPVLAAASQNPTIMSPLATILAQRPTWADAFLIYLSGTTKDPEQAVSLFKLLGTRNIAVPEGARAALVNSLIASQKFNAAWAYYKSMFPKSDPRVSRDADFAAGSDAPTAFDWSASTEAGISVAIQRGSSRGLVTFAAAPTVGARLLQQTQLLTAGRYRLKGHSNGLDQSVEERPYWLLQCLATGRELGRVIMPNSKENGGWFEGKFSVGSDCPAQLLVLVAPPSSALAGLSGELDYLLLAPTPDAVPADHSRSRSS